MIFGRLRFSDAQGSHIELDAQAGNDHGYLECETSRRKTSTSLEKRVRLLPVVIPTRSFTAEGWIETWLKL